MKKKPYSFRFLPLLLGCMLSLAVSSCLYEEPELTENGEEGVDPTLVNVSTDLSINLDITSVIQQSTRAEAVAHHRFIVEAYWENKVVARQEFYEAIIPGRTQLNLPLSLKLNARKYQLAIWSDYVTPTEVENKYNFYFYTEALSKIRSVDSYKGNLKYKDAFYGSTTLDLTGYRDQWNAEVSADIQMKRPMARYELIATDVAKFLKRLKDKEIIGNEFTATIKYDSYLPLGFNALTGKVGHSLMYIQYAKAFTTPVEGTEELSIGFDQLFVNGEGSFVPVSIEITDRKNKVIARMKGLKVPYEQDHNTTIRGSFLTSNPDPGINFDPDFDGDINVDLDRIK